MGIVPAKCICPEPEFELLFHYDEPPKIEAPFPLEGLRYERDIYRCKKCGHCQSSQAMIPDLAKLYAGSYFQVTYQNAEGVRSAFERIIGLPKEKSDNQGRVERLLKAIEAHFGRRENISLLDVGSGLGVFPYRMSRESINCTCIEPDPIACEHLTKNLGLKAVCAYLSADLQLGAFDVITLNKVAEHVADPIGFLEDASAYLTPGGLLYIEVPDAEGAAKEGSEREEFLIDHPHIFSAASLTTAVKRSGLRVLSLERIHEPSTKYTVYAVCSKN